MRWTESIVIDRPAADVYRAIADEHEVLAWSAWPEATGFTCAIEGDGTAIGSSIVFSKGGEEQGRQRLAALDPDRLVAYRLANRGPRGTTWYPEVDFRLEPRATDVTQVHLDFSNQVPLPAPLRQLAEVLLGRRVRALHRKDLERLKAHVEA